MSLRISKVGMREDPAGLKSREKYHVPKREVTISRAALPAIASGNIREIEGKGKAEASGKDEALIPVADPAITAQRELNLITTFLKREKLETSLALFFEISRNKNPTLALQEWNVRNHKENILSGEQLVALREYVAGGILAQEQLDKIESDLVTFASPALKRFNILKLRYHSESEKFLEKWKEDEKKQAEKGTTLALTTPSSATAPSTGALSESTVEDEKIVKENLPQLFEELEEFQGVLLSHGLLSKRTDLNHLKTLTLLEIFNIALIIPFISVYLTHKSAGKLDPEFFNKAKQFLIEYVGRREVTSIEEVKNFFEVYRELIFALGKERGKKIERCLICIKNFFPLLNKAIMKKPVEPARVQTSENLPFLACIANLRIEIATTFFSNDSAKGFCEGFKSEAAKVAGRGASLLKSQSVLKMVSRGNDYKLIDAFRKLASNILFVFNGISTNVEELRNLTVKMVHETIGEDPYHLYLTYKPILNGATALNKQIKKFGVIHLQRLQGHIAWMGLTIGMKTPCADSIQMDLYHQLMKNRCEFYLDLSSIIEEHVRRINKGYLDLPINSETMKSCFHLILTSMKLCVKNNSKVIVELKKEIEQHKKILEAAGFCREFINSLCNSVSEVYRKLSRTTISQLKKFHEGIFLGDIGIDTAIEAMSNQESEFLVGGFEAFVNTKTFSEEEFSFEFAEGTFRECLNTLHQLSAAILSIDKEKSFDIFMKDLSNASKKERTEKHGVVDHENRQKLIAILYSISLDITIQSALLVELLETMYPMIGNKLDALVGGWTKALDLEYSLPDLQDKIFDSEIAKPKGLSPGRKAKRKGKKSATHSPKMPTRSPVAYVLPASTSAKVMAIVTATHSPFKKIYDRLLAKQGLETEVLPEAVIGTKSTGSIRLQEARYDQRLFLHCLERTNELLQCRELFHSPKELNGLGLQVFTISWVLGNLILERGFTAEIIEREIRCVLAHDVVFLRGRLGQETTGHPFLSRFRFALLDYRYSSGCSAPFIPPLTEWEPLMRDLFSLIVEQLSEEETKCEEEFKELSALGATLGTKKFTPGVISPDVLKRLAEMESVLQARLKRMHEVLAGMNEGEAKRTLIHIVHLFTALRFIPTFISHFPQQRFLIIPALFLRIVSMYLCENIGLYRKLLNGKAHVVFGMGGDVHKLQAYCKPEKEEDVVAEEIYLDSPLKPGSRARRTLAMLSQEGKPEYPYNLLAISEMGKLVSEAYAWSLAHVNDEGVWVLPSMKAHASPESLFAEFQMKLVNRCEEIVELAEQLSSYHVCDEGRVNVK